MSDHQWDTGQAQRREIRRTTVILRDENGGDWECIEVGEGSEGSV